MEQLFFQIIYLYNQIFVVFRESLVIVSIVTDCVLDFLNMSWIFESILQLLQFIACINKFLLSDR